jgi:hypothetical protein
VEASTGNVPPQVTRQKSVTDYQRYVEERLFSIIGAHERHGPSWWLWSDGLEKIPATIDMLCGVVEDMKRTGKRFTRTKSANPTAAYLNSAVHKALDMYHQKEFFRP